MEMWYFKRVCFYVNRHSLFAFCFCFVLFTFLFVCLFVFCLFFFRFFYVFFFFVCFLLFSILFLILYIICTYSDCVNGIRLLLKPLYQYCNLTSFKYCLFQKLYHCFSVIHHDTHLQGRISNENIIICFHRRHLKIYFAIGQSLKNYVRWSTDLTGYCPITNT